MEYVMEWRDILDTVVKSIYCWPLHDTKPIKDNTVLTQVEFMGTALWFAQKEARGLRQWPLTRGSQV